MCCLYTRSGTMEDVLKYRRQSSDRLIFLDGQPAILAPPLVLEFRQNSWVISCRMADLAPDLFPSTISSASQPWRVGLQILSTASPSEENPSSEVAQGAEPLSFGSRLMRWAARLSRARRWMRSGSTKTPRMMRFTASASRG